MVWKSLTWSTAGIAALLPPALQQSAPQKDIGLVFSCISFHVIFSLGCYERETIDIQFPQALDVQ